MAEVTKKLAVFRAEPPRVEGPRTEGPVEDVFAQFRDVEVVELHWEQTYRHSLDKYSRFFLELENKRFLATRCPKCETVWAPPRPVCPNDLAITEWVELPGTGVIEGFSICEFAPAFVSNERPYVLAYVALDGADTLFCHELRNYGDRNRIQEGMPVKVVYSEGPVEHPIRLMHFEPAE